MTRYINNNSEKKKVLFFLTIYWPRDSSTRNCWTIRIRKIKTAFTMLSIGGWPEADAADDSSSNNVVSSTHKLFSVDSEHLAEWQIRDWPHGILKALFRTKSFGHKWICQTDPKSRYDFIGWYFLFCCSFDAASTPAFVRFYGWHCLIRSGKKNSSKCVVWYIY